MFNHTVGVSSTIQQFVIVVRYNMVKQTLGEIHNKKTNDAFRIHTVYF